MTLRSQLTYETGIHRTVAAGLLPVADYVAAASNYGEGMSLEMARGVALAIGILRSLHERALPFTRKDSEGM